MDKVITTLSWPGAGAAAPAAMTLPEFTEAISTVRAYPKP
jgi:hypothetical protein